MTESKIPADKKSQLERFKEAAKSSGTDDSEEAFDRVLRKVSRGPAGKKPAPGKSKRASEILGDD